MAKLGNTVIVGIIWIVIAIAIALFGTKLTSQPGLVSIIGWIISIIGYGFAAASTMHLFRMVSGNMKAIKWQEKDPEGFKKKQEEYRNAMERNEGE